MDYEAMQNIAKRNHVESILSIQFNTKDLEDKLLYGYECPSIRASDSYLYSMKSAAPYAIVWQPMDGLYQLINWCDQTFCELWNPDGELLHATYSSRGFYLHNEPGFLHKEGENYYLIEEHTAPWLSEDDAQHFLETWQRIKKFFEWELAEIYPPLITIGFVYNLLSKVLNLQICWSPLSTSGQMTAPPSRNQHRV